MARQPPVISRWKYLRLFARNWQQIGSLTPSSDALAAAMTRPIDFERSHVLVEYGPGNGVFTRRILERLRPDGRLLAMEVNAEFAQYLAGRLDDPRFELAHASAEQVAEHLERMGVPAADVIVSALPFSNFSAELTQTILARSLEALRPGGMFVAVQYVPFRLLRALRATFGNGHINELCWRNLPPAFVLVAQR